MLLCTVHIVLTVEKNNPLYGGTEATVMMPATSINDTGPIKQHILWQITSIDHSGQLSNIDDGKHDDDDNSNDKNEEGGYHINDLLESEPESENDRV